MADLDMCIFFVLYVFIFVLLLIVTPVHVLDDSAHLSSGSLEDVCK